MRLPWPFRRPAPEAGIAAPAGGVDGPMAGAVPPVGRAEWREVGSLRPSFAGDPGIRVQRFRADLAGSQLPPPILGPLGHARDADGPAGLVSGLTRPVVGGTYPGMTSGAHLDLRPHRTRTTVQRAMEPGPEPTIELSSEVGTNDGLGSTPLPAIAVRQAAPIIGAAARSGPLLTVARTPQLVGAPTSSPAATPAPRAAGTPVEMPAPAALAPLPGGGRTIVRGPGGSRVRLGAPIQRDALTTGASTTAAVSATTDDPGSSPSVAGADAPLVGTLRPLVESAAAETTPSDATPVIPGGLVLARVVHPTANSTIDPSTSGDDDARPGSGGSPTARPSSVAPLVGRTPLQPTSWPLPTPEVAAVASTSVPAGSGPLASPGSGRVAPSTVQRSGTPGTIHQSEPVATIARSATGPASVLSRVSPGGTPATMTSTTGDPMSPIPLRRVAAVPTGAVSVAGAVGAVPTMAPAPGARRMVQRHASVEAPSASTPSPLAQDEPVLELARLVAPGVPAIVQREARSGPHGITTTSTRNGGVAVPGSVTIQRAPADEGPGPGPSESASTSEPPSIGASAPAAASPLAGLADRDLDEMVRRLYPRLRRTLSSELLVARERAGVLADLR